MMQYVTPILFAALFVGTSAQVNEVLVYEPTNLEDTGESIAEDKELYECKYKDVSKKERLKYINVKLKMNV